MTQAAVYIALRTFLAAVLVLDEALVQIERRGKARVNRPECVIRELRDVGVGRGELDGAAVEQQRRLVVQVEGRGEPVAVGLQRVAVLLDSYSPDVDTLTAAGVGIIDVGPLRDLTRLGGRAFERTTSFDLTLSYTASVSSTASVAATSLATTLDSGDGLQPLDVCPIP